MMTNALRIHLRAFAVLLIGGMVLFVGGCEFLGFGSDEPAVIIDDNDDDGEGENGDDSYDGAVETITLFDDDVELIDGYSLPITVDAPDNVFSISISVTEGSAYLYYGVTDWHHEDGFSIVPPNWEGSSTQICYVGCNNRIALQPGAFGGLAPNNPDSQVEPGEYHFQVFGIQVDQGFLGELPGTHQTNPTVRVTVHAEILHEDVPDTGVLDLNVFFTGANGWTADSVEDDPSFQSTLETVDNIYDQIGIDIGEVAYYDIDSSYQVIEDISSGGGDLSQMFTESSRATLEGPSVFFVSELTSPFGSILGIAGGIPGPMIVDGSVRSGVAIATDSVNAPGAPSMGHVVAHEVGHYLGLFHTTENFAFPGMPEHDPLPDTPEYDESYLMHAAGSGDKMSEWQGRVLRKNPWVYHP